MKRLLIACSLWLCLVPALFAGTTTVSGTITDPNGQAFANGNITATFRPSPDRPTDTYTSNGATFSQTITATLNGSGAFAGMVLTDSLTVSPANSSWIFTVCSNTSAPCFQYTAPNGSITGGALSLTGVLTAAAPVIKIQPNINIMQFAYADSEIISPTFGTVYYNTISSSARIFNGISWAALSSSSAWASGGVTTGVLCKSNGAGLCLDSAWTDNSSNLTGTEPLVIPVGGVSTQSLNFGANFSFYSPATNTLRYSSAGSDKFEVSNQGLVITQNGSHGLSFSSTGNINSPDSFFKPLAGGTAQGWQFGANANATPKVYTVQFGESATGTNTVGGNGTITGGNGTGSGGGGSLIFQTGVPHGSDAVADTFTTGLIIDKNQLVTAPVSLTSPHVAATTDLTLASGVAQTGTQGSTGTKLFSCIGSFTSGDFVKTDANGNCVDGGASAASVVTKEFTTVTAATQSGTAATTYFLNGQTVLSAEFVQGAKFVIESTSKWTNNDSTLARTTSFGVGIDGTSRGSCSAASIAIGATGFGTDRLTMTVMTTGVGGTVLISNECASSTTSTETSSATPLAFDTTASHTFTTSIAVPAVDTSSTGTSLILTGYRFF